MTAAAESGPRRYHVVAVDPDHRERTGLAIRLAGVTSQIQATIEEALAVLTPGEPAVAVFGPGLANDTGLAQAQRLARSNPEIGVVLVATELSMGLLQQALRAGVRDALTMDVEEAQVRQAVERVGETMVALVNRQAASYERAEHGRVIVTFSTKGGVGKSIIATSVGAWLALRQSRPVVVVDGDLPFGAVAVLLGVPPPHTTLDAASAIGHADSEMMDGLLATHEASGMRVLPAPIEPSAADQISPQQMLAIVQFMRSMFAYVIVDLPPHFDNVVLALLEEADDVLLVASMDIPSIKNLKVGIQTLDLLSLAGTKMKLVLNRANAKVNLDIADVERALGIPAEFRIPSDIAVPQAVNRGVPVIIDKPKSAAALALQHLADSFLDAAPDDDGGEAPEQRRRPWRRSEKQGSTE